MKVVRFTSAERYEPEENWTRASLCGEDDISIEHFVKPAGHASPLHDHPNAQILIVIDGELAIFTEKDGEERLAPGDTVYIPGGEPHIVTNPLERPSSGIDIFVPGRSFDFWLERARNKE
jgi:quercetin dioxygenase-like cupin family protein